MAKWLRIVLVLVFICLPLMTGCSSDKDKNEKGAYRKQTDQIANEAVKSIKTPKDRARSAVEAQEGHDQKIKDQMKE